MSLNHLATTLSELGRREDALAAAEEAVSLHRTLAAQHPDAFRPDLALSLNNLANMLRDLGGREDALAAAEESVSLRRTLAAQRPDAFRPDLAMSLHTLANRLSDLGRREDALAAAEEAVSLYRTLAAQRPDAFTVQFCRSLWVLGDLKVEAGEHARGIAALAAGVAGLAPAFRAYPAAIQGTMIGLLQSYLKACETAAHEPDQALLEPIIATMQQVHQAAATSQPKNPGNRPNRFIRSLFNAIRR